MAVWMAFRAGLDILEKTKIKIPFQEWNPCSFIP
jgi:hypothetical protein